MRFPGARLALAAVFGAGLWPQPASANSDRPYDVALIPACVAAAGASRPAVEACKGAGAGPCPASDDGVIGLVLCWDAEASSWRDVLDRAYAQRRAAEPQRRRSLGRAQAAWARWRDVECAYRGDEEDGGSGAQVDQARCIADMTADRAIDLLHRS